MNDPKIMSEVPPLLKSRQYYAASFRRIEATINRDVPYVLDQLRKDVANILKEAMDGSCYPEANRIIRNLGRFLPKDVYDEAQLELNGITIPENVEDLADDDKALLL